MISTPDTTSSHTASHQFKQALITATSLTALQPLSSTACIDAIKSLHKELEHNSTMTVLFITHTLVGAIDLSSLLSLCMPKGAVSLKLPHQQSVDTSTQITVIPHINLLLTNSIPPSLNGFNAIFFEVNAADNISGLLDCYKRIFIDIAEPTQLIACDLARIVDIQATSMASKKTIKEPKRVATKVTQETAPKKKTTTKETTTLNSIVYVDRSYKRGYLRNLLKKSNDKKCLVITRTRHNAHRLEEYLYQGRVRARIIHANLPEAAIQRIVERFDTNEINIIIAPENSIQQAATLTNIDQVIFFDLPDISEDFKIRIEKINSHLTPEQCISIVTQDEKNWIDAMEEELGYILPKEITERPEPQTKIANKEIKPEEPQQTPHKRGSKTKFLRSHKDPQRAKPAPKQNRKKKEYNKNTPNSVNTPGNTNKAETVHHEDSFNQSDIVNENRSPFASDSFEANIARENKKRVKQFFTQKAPEPKRVQEYPSSSRSSDNVKIVRRKRRTLSNDVDGNS